MRCSLLFCVSEFTPCLLSASLAFLVLSLPIFESMQVLVSSFFPLSLVFVSLVFQLPFCTLYILAIIAYSKRAFRSVALPLSFSLSLYLFELFVLRIS